MEALLIIIFSPVNGIRRQQRNSPQAFSNKYSPHFLPLLSKVFYCFVRFNFSFALGEIVAGLPLIFPKLEDQKWLKTCAFLSNGTIFTWAVRTGSSIKVLTMRER